IHDPALLNMESIFGEYEDLAEEARKGSSDANVYWNLGARYLESGEYYQALRAFEKANDLCPDDTEILTQMGVLLCLHLNRMDDAIPLLQKALASQKAPADAYFALANLLQKRERCAEAEETVKRGLELFPDDPRLHETLRAIRHA